MKFFRRRKLVAVLALIAGAALIFFELYRPTSKGESCFWLPVGGLIVILSLLELLTKAPPEDPS